MPAFPVTTPHYARFIASELLAARRARGLTQSDLGQLAGVRTATVCRAEKEPHRMSLECLMKIASALQMTVILTSDDPQTARSTKPRIRSL